jgi:hypothetical protein
MSIVVVSYSLTGNNQALAIALAQALSVDHIRVTEKGPRKTITILMDMLLNRTPKVQPAPSALEPYDRVFFVAPVWMGKTASPLRAYFQYLKAHPRSYAFASISGGALNANPGLADDLEKRVGAKPAALVDLHIADLLPKPKGSKPTMEDTSAYRLTNEDVQKLITTLMETAGNVMG